MEPYIKLDPKYPGIVAGFMYDMENARNLSKMGQTIMRRARSLTVGERELIAAYTSKLNDCHFCYESHAACAAEFVGPVLVDQVVMNLDSTHLNPRMRALLGVAAQVRSLNRYALPIAIEEAKQAGASDQQIHDTVLVTAFFAMCNRYVDGLGTTFKPEEAIEGGVGLAKYGYVLSIRRFFGEILPKLWAAFRGKK